VENILNPDKFETLNLVLIVIKMSFRTFVRASLNGIVYLIDAQKGRVYTYNPDSPVYIGDLERIPGEELMTSEGNLTGAKLILKESWESTMKDLLLKA
jgi:hypothetical protein